MADRFRRTFEFRVSDLQRLKNCVVEHARVGEERQVERILGALVTVEAAAAAAQAEQTTFTAPRGTAELLQRALRAMAQSDRHAERAQRHGHTAA